MRFQIKLGLTAVALLAMALPLSAYSGFVIGTPNASDFGDCDAAALTFTGSDVAQMFVLREGGTGSNDILYSIEGNSKVLGGTYGSDGIYDFPGANFQTPPTTNEETVWVLVTTYPGGAADGAHQGWFHIDNTPGLSEDMAPGPVPNVIQTVRLPNATAGVIQGGDPALDDTTGVDVSFEYPTEFGGGVDQVGTLPCDIGGLQTPDNVFENRLFLGFNVYRINVTQSGLDAATSVPADYLCGPDGDCTTTADNGFVGFVQLGDFCSALCVDDPTDTTGSGPGGVEDRGNTNPDIVFSDHVSFQPSDPGLTTDVFTYVYQPVIKGNPSGTWNGMPALDLDGDTIPEFVSPGGQGLGLTANGPTPTAPTILISSDVVVDGGTPTPVDGAVDLKAALEGNGLNLSFLSSLEGNVVGFHIYRSMDGQSYVQATQEMIPSTGTPLHQYGWTDNMNVRRIKADSLTYKVEAVLGDGSTQMYGPFEVSLEGMKDAPKRGRRR